MPGWRANRRGLFHRETYEVTGIRADGALDVTPLLGAGPGGPRLGEPMVLPACYVAQHLALAYATGHMASRAVAGGGRRDEGGAGVLRWARGYPVPVRPTPGGSSISVEGAAAGAIATVVMTAVLEGGRRLSLFCTHPPARIVRRVLAGSPERRVSHEVLLTGLAHIGNGASCGALFALLTRRHTAAGPRLGVGYGLLLWLAGYGLWVPAIGAVPPPHRDRPGRQIALVAGHVVYGAVLAEGLRTLRRRSGAMRGTTTWGP